MSVPEVVIGEPEMVNPVGTLRPTLVTSPSEEVPISSQPPSV